MILSLLSIHLICAAAAIVMFWAAVVTEKGGPTHRTMGRWFARLVYGAAITGGVLATIGLASPASMPVADPRPVAETTRHLMWLILYLLLVVVVPVQHGLATVAAGPSPARLRSPLHATLNLAGLAATLLLFPAALVWHEWWFLVAVPATFIVALRNMSYASRRAADPASWQQEHLTSMITAGIALHTAWFLISATRWPALTANGTFIWIAWIGPALVGLPAVWLLRRARV